MKEASRLAVSVPGGIPRRWSHEKPLNSSVTRTFWPFETNEARCTRLKCPRESSVEGSKGRPCGCTMAWRHFTSSCRSSPLQG